MTTTLSPKQPAEAYAISFNFASDLSAEIIAGVPVITAIDRVSLEDVEPTLLDVTKQTNTDTIVYGWVRAGTSGHEYVITCTITGSGGSVYELDAILPVTEAPDTGVVSGGGLVTGPVIEPITLDELKIHLKMDSGSFADNVDEVQSIAPGLKAFIDDWTTHEGTGVNVLGYTAIFSFAAGIFTATGTADVKIQESDDDITYIDWSGGVFTQVTEANDETTYERAYTGTKEYARAVAKVLVDDCSFGVSVIRRTATSIEDDLLNDIIKEAREHVEDITRRCLLTQTWDYSLQEWPGVNYIKLPGGNLQSVSSIKWKDTDGTETALTAGTDYLIEQNGEQCGKVVLPYGGTWPSKTLYPSNPIVIRFVAGWTTRALVPFKIKAAIKRICAKLYESKGEDVLGQTVHEDKTVMNLLQSRRLWDEF